MSHALDTNLLVRSLHEKHPMQPVAAQAVEKLLDRGVALHIFPQNLYEFWVVATRPIEQNGLGMDMTKTLHELVRLKGALQVLPDVTEIYPEWERLVSQHSVAGRRNSRRQLAWRRQHVHALFTARLQGDDPGKRQTDGGGQWVSNARRAPPRGHRDFAA